MSVTDEVLRNAEQYASSFDKGDLPMPPARKLAVVACMDARLIPTRVLGLDEGDAHIIRNAGGVVTDDTIRSLAISQRLLGTEEIILIHHTDCGMLTFKDEDFKRSIQEETGIKQRGRRRRSATSTRTYASPSRASGPAPSSRARTCAGSSTRSRAGGCARSPDRGYDAAGAGSRRRPFAVSVTSMLPRVALE